MAAVGFANPYIGVESGDDVVLKRINKGYTAAQARKQLTELIEAMYPELPAVFAFIHARISVYQIARQQKEAEDRVRTVSQKTKWTMSMLKRRI